MSWHYSQELVVEYSAECSVDFGQFAPRKSKNIRVRYYCSDRMMESLIRSLCGTTSEHLTDVHGVDTLTSSPADSRVKTYPQQEKVQASQGNDPDCGLSSLASLGKYDQDTHSLRTHQCSLFEGLTSSSVILPRWGMMRDGVLYPLKTPALISENLGTIHYKEGKWIFDFLVEADNLPSILTDSIELEK